MAACELAGVEPTFTTYEGNDADGYALSVNIARRHMTKGQLAMLIVDAKPELFRDETVSANTLMIGKATISKARHVAGPVAPAFAIRHAGAGSEIHKLGDQRVSDRG